jgi:hypothetical protein
MGHTREEFSHFTPPRIMGSESEINVPGLEDDYYGDLTFCGAVVDANIAHLARGRDDGSIILPNGGEIYLDVERLMESATPECTNAHEVLLHELIGEYAVHQIAKHIPDNPKGNAYKRAGYAEIKHPDGIIIQKANSTGHHENYFHHEPSSRIQINQEHDEMKSYLSTRSSWAGTGLITANGYAVSQKIGALDFNNGGSYTTHGTKSTVLSHDTRLETRTGEGNMSEWAIVQKFALTSLVLRLIEHGEFPSDLRIENHRQTVEASPFAFVKTDRGRFTGYGHQRAIARSALNYFAPKNGVPEEELLAAEAVIKACDAIGRIKKLENNDLSSIDDRVEWASKLSYLRRKYPSSSLHTGNMHAVAMDLNWDNIAPHGSGKLWYKIHGSTTDAATIKQYTTIPPTTRATARVATLTQLRNEKVDVDNVFWHRIDYDEGTHNYPDPYEAA